MSIEAQVTQEITMSNATFLFDYSGPTNYDLDENCEAVLDWGHPSSVTLEYQGDPGGMITFFDVNSISGGYQIGDVISGKESVRIEYLARDNMGNSATFAFRIYFVDNIKPIIDVNSVPSGIYVNCISELPDTVRISATDNCDGPNEIIYYVEDVGIVPPCESGTISRRYYAEDQSGNRSNRVQLILVAEDTIKPIFTGLPESDTVSCAEVMSRYEVWLSTQRGRLSATDEGCGEVTYSDNAPELSQIIDSCGSIEINFFATDLCANQQIATAYFVIEDAISPSISKPAGDIFVECSTGRAMQDITDWLNDNGGARATDNCNSISWSTIPEDVLSALSCDTVLTVEFIATDPCGNSTSTTAELSLNDNTPPSIFSQPRSDVVQCSGGDIFAQFQSYIDNSGNGNIGDHCTSTENLIFMYIIGGDTVSFSSLVDSLSISYENGCEDSIFIEDAYYNNVLAYIDFAFLITDLCGNERSTEQVRWGIRDLGGPSLETPGRDTIFACESQAFLIQSITDWYNHAAYAEIIDDCGGISVNSTPTFQEIIDTISGGFNDCNGENGILVEFYISDKCGNPIDTSFTAMFGVLDSISPEISKQARDTSFQCSDSIQVMLEEYLDKVGYAQYSDGCSNDFNIAFLWSDNAGNTGAGNTGLGPYPQLEGSGCDYSLDIEWRIFDLCGNQSTTMASWTLIDTMPPDFSNFQDSINVNCDSIPGIEAAEAIYQCAINLNISFEQIEYRTGDINSCDYYNYYIIRRYFLDNSCGGLDTLKQVIFVEDNIAPEFVLPSDITLGCGTMPDVSMTGEPTAIDLCGSPVDIEYRDDSIIVDCGIEIIRYWVFSDVCMNKDTGIQTISLIDTLAPSILSESTDTSITCNQLGDISLIYDRWILGVKAGFSAFDSCGLAYSFIARTGSYNIGDSSSYPSELPIWNRDVLCGDDTLAIDSIDLVAIDYCGLYTVERLHFAVIDTTPPAIICPSDTLTLYRNNKDCLTRYYFNTITADDSCSVSDTLKWTIVIGDDVSEFSSLDTQSIGLDIGSYSTSYTVADCSGNTSTCPFVINVIDTIAPEILCPSDTVIGAGSSGCSATHILPTVFLSSHCDTLSSYQYKITGATTLPSGGGYIDFQEGQEVVLNAGENYITYRLVDEYGNENSCTYKVTITDSEKPVAVCRNIEVRINVSGEDSIIVSAEDIDGGSFDNCTLDSIYVSAHTIDCGNIGDTVYVTLYVVDRSGNLDSCIASVYVQAEEWNVTYSLDFCSPDTLYLFSEIPSDSSMSYVYKWTGPGNFTSSVRNPIIINPQSAQSGRYVLEITGKTGCSDSRYIDIDIENFAEPQLLSSASVICYGDSIVLSSSAYNDSITYNWYQRLGTQDTLITQTLSRELVLYPDTGAYDIFVVASNTECSSNESQIVNVEVINRPSVQVLSDSIRLCEGESLSLGITDINDQVFYSWEGPDNYKSQKPLPDTIDPVTPSNSGFYFVRAYKGSCSSDIDSIHVDVTPMPVQPDLDLNVNVCEGDTIKLVAESVVAYGNYEWVHESGRTYHTDSTELILIADPTLHAGFWKLRSIDNNCFSELSDSVEVLINPLPIAEILYNGPVCRDGLVELFATVEPGAQYRWIAPDGSMGTGSTVIFDAIEGNYILQVTSDEFCKKNDTIQLDFTEPAIISEVSQSIEECIHKGDDLFLTVQTDPLADSTFNYQWIDVQGTIKTEDTLRINNFDSDKNGIYKLVVGRGVCYSDTFNYNLDITLIPENPRIFDTPIFCTDEAITFTVDSNISNADEYHWYFGSDTTVTVGKTFVIPELDSGTYEVVVRAYNGLCFSDDFDTLIFNVIKLPELGRISGENTLCTGDSLYLSVPNIDGATYIWESPDGTLDTLNYDLLIYPADTSHSGNYRVKVIAGPCSSEYTDFIPVLVNPNPELPVIDYIEDAICIREGEVMRACIETNSATAGASYQWINADNGTELGNPTRGFCIDIDDLSSFVDGSNFVIVKAIVEKCASVTSLPYEIELTRAPDETSIAGQDISSCESTVSNLSAQMPNKSIGRWTILTDGAEIDDVSDPKTGVKTLIPGINQFVWSLSYGACDAFSVDTVTVFYDVAPVADDDNYVMPFGGELELDIEANDEYLGGFNIEIVDQPQNGRIRIQGQEYTYFPNNGYIGEDSFRYRICSAVCVDKCSEATVDIQVGDDSLCDIPTIFTPNNDGTNDFFIIQCLSSTTYQDNTVRIFNINGDEVFYAAPYENNWSGMYNGSQLPVGTYYFIVDFGDGNIKKGFLMLER